MTDNSLIREEASVADEGVRVPIYDPAAKNRFEFTVTQDGHKYDIAHIFGELTDERYVRWLKEMNIHGSEDDIKEESREAACRLWDDIIDRVEGVEFEEGDWKAYVPYREKVEAVNQLIAVAIAEDEEKAATGKLRLGPSSGNVKVTTEAWSNGEVVQQRHELRAVTLELEKKYNRIQGKRFKQEQAKGFRKKQKVTHIPQDEKLGELYDEMLVSVEGFEKNPVATASGSDGVPLRFKTAALHEIFASPIDPKK